jgi:hypothetical protein
MSDIATVPPQDLIHDLTKSLWRSRSALRDLARRKAWEPSIEDCRRIAECQVEQLRRHGVLHVTRSVARAHGVGSEQPIEAPAPMPIWAPSRCERADTPRCRRYTHLLARAEPAR